MSIRSAATRAAGMAAGLSLLLAAGCAGMKRAPPEEPPPPATALVSTPAVESPAVGTAKPEPKATVAPEPRAAPKVAGGATAVPHVTAAKPQPSDAAEPALAPRPTPAPPHAPTAVTKAAPAPVATRPPETPPLDLKSLETRLRETQAIGVFTKISLKNQVDDLLKQFRAYHQRQTTTTLAALRQSYNLLLLKVLALLQDSDPSLARDIVASREAIWGILADPRRFTESDLMAGAKS